MPKLKEESAKEAAGKGKAPQSPRYSSRDRILNAKSLDNVF
jgi:hypothetical protein